jgi:hypothetical protein
MDHARVVPHLAATSRAALSPGYTYGRARAGQPLFCCGEDLRLGAREREKVTYATGQLGEKVTAADYIRPQVHTPPRVCARGMMKTAGS